MPKGHVFESATFVDNTGLRRGRTGRVAAALLLAGSGAWLLGGCGSGAASHVKTPTMSAASTSSVDAVHFTGASDPLPHCHDFKDNKNAETISGKDPLFLVMSALALKGEPVDHIVGTAICDPTSGVGDVYQVHEDDSFAGDYGKNCAAVGAYAKEPERSVIVCVSPSELQ